MQLQVGKKYRLRNGEVMTVIQRLTSPKFHAFRKPREDRMVGSVNGVLENFCENGTYLLTGRKHDYDVMTRID